MTVIRKYIILAQGLALISAFLAVTLAHADDVLGYLTNKDGAYVGPSLEDNVVSMDTDKNGFADVYEVRAFLELKHGKGYQKEVFDKMEASARTKSCSTSFAKDLYIDTSNKLESHN
jgi:hypothetical protein